MTGAPAGESQISVPADPERVDRTSRRLIRAIGLLLILQVVGLAGLGAYEFTQVDWEELDLETPPLEVIEAAAFVFFIPPAVLALLAALGLLFLARRGWLLAAISQGLCLGICLWLYTELNPYYVYPIMAYCILMIFYLNSHDVRMAFHAGRVPSEQSPETTRGS